jgi:hypothetical protein
VQDVPQEQNSSSEQVCGCGYEFCCGQCVPIEEKKRIQAENDQVVFTHCSPECSCGGIPTLLKVLRSGKEL